MKNIRNIVQSCNSPENDSLWLDPNGMLKWLSPSGWKGIYGAEILPLDSLGNSTKRSITQKLSTELHEDSLYKFAFVYDTDAFSFYVECANGHEESVVTGQHGKSYSLFDSPITNLSMYSGTYFKIYKIDGNQYKFDFSMSETLKELDLTCVDFSKITDMTYAFTQMPVITDIKLPNIIYNNIINGLYETFSNNPNLINIGKKNYITFYCPNLTSSYATFSGCTSLKNITLFFIGCTNMASLTELFSGCNSLAEVTIFTNSTITSWNNAFAGCTSLTSVSINSIRSNISFEDSPSLIVNSIIRVLDDRVDQTSLTLKLHPTVKAALTAQQIAEITGLNWTIA